jgi:hypothetical protein
LTRVYVVVEGSTEESFVNEILAPVLRPREVYLTPIILGPPGHKGGNTNYARVKKDVLVQLKQDRAAYCSTMLDFYSLGRGFPGMPLPANLTNIEKVNRIEQAVKADIGAQVPDTRADLRFLPYLQLHEYEGLLFSDPAAFARGIYAPNLAASFQQVRNEFPTPEDINDGPDTAPSKRVVRLSPGYRKPLHGTLAALEVGVNTMRQECPHFREWVERLEALAANDLDAAAVT